MLARPQHPLFAAASYADDQVRDITTKVVGTCSLESDPAASFGLTTGWNREHLWCDSYGLESREPPFPVTVLPAPD